MKTLIALAALAAAFTTTAPAQEKDARCFEMRTYFASPGKLDALQTRFRDHTCKLFEKHGMVNIGYWTPAENSDSKLIYVLAYPDREARNKSWQGFMADPDWKAAYTASEKNGTLVAKVETRFMTATDFSPVPTASPAAIDARAIELRTYTTTPGHLPNLLARFRDHTCKLFEKHGMVNMAYWTPSDKEPGADNTLVYLLAHTSKEAAAKSFNSFRADPVWIAAKTASEEKAGGSLTIPEGIKSTFMTATDYSAIK